MSTTEPPAPPKRRHRATGPKRKSAGRYTAAERAAAYGTAPPKMGRPTLLTPELQEKVVQLVRAGNFLNTACGVAGVHISTVYTWFEAARDPASPQIYKDFLEAVQKAQYEAEALLLNDVRLAGTVDAKGQPKGSKHWQASLEILSRKWPARWGRRDVTTIRHEHDHVPQPAVVQAQVEPSAEDAADARSVLERATAALARAEARAERRQLGPKKDDPK